MARSNEALSTSDRMLSAKSAATHLDIGLSTFWRYVKEGRFPQAFYINSHQPRWRLSELTAAIDATRPAVAA